LEEKLFCREFSAWDFLVFRYKTKFFVLRYSRTCPSILRG